MYEARAASVLEAIIAKGKADAVEAKKKALAAKADAAKAKKDAVEAKKDKGTSKGSAMVQSKRYCQSRKESQSISVPHREGQQGVQVRSRLSGQQALPHWNPRSG